MTVFERPVEIVFKAVVCTTGSDRRAVGCAAVLTGVDVYYVSVGRIARIYLLDAAAETFLVVAWIGAYFR